MARSQSIGRKRVLGLELSTTLERLLLAGGTLLALALIAMSLPSYPLLAHFRAESLREMPNVLAPLVILALFIERGVEVVLAGWRAAGAAVRESELTQAMQRGTVDEQWTARADLQRYRASSQRLAFSVAFVLALLISMMGVRAIEMLVDPVVVGSAQAVQRSLFVWVDIMVTALLLTGGANGIHKVVNAFTTFIDQTEKRVREAGGQRGGGETAVAGDVGP